MQNSDITKTAPLKKWCPKSKKRFLFSFIILAFLLIVLFLVAGYYSAFKTKSYLPAEIPVTINLVHSEINPTKIITPWYKLIVDQNGMLSVNTTTDEVIMSGLTYYAEHKGVNERWGLENVVVKQTNDSIITITGYSSDNTLVHINLVTHKNLSKLDIQIKTQYNVNTIVKREALVASFDVPVTEVYRKNRTVDIDKFEPEYWLNKEGARFGSKARSALIYHNPNISSLQLQTEKKLLFVNLVYFLDHPYGYAPFSKSKRDNLQERSEANYTKGSERINQFSINFGLRPKVTPRLMAVPYGFQSAYIFTEHADGGTLKTQRAAYFGSESVINAKDAIGGFVKYKIPVTKSVFFIDSSKLQGVSVIGLNNDTSLRNFLDQLYATGLYDICLHTPDEMNSSRAVLEEAIKFMKTRYNTITWIDHGFFRGLINREAFVAEGLDSSSKFYAADLWEKYDTRYFWSPQIEYNRDSLHVSLTDHIKKLQFYKAYSSLWQNFLSPRELKEMNPIQAIKELRRRYSNKFESNSLMPGMGDSYPTPLYWKHPTMTADFYSWSTDFVELYTILSPNVVEQQKIQIDNLVKNWGIYLSHGYYVRTVDSEILLSDEKGKLYTNPYFNDILHYIAQKRDNGELYTTTVRDLLDYWIKLDHVSFEYLPDGSITISNNNVKPIKGISIVMRTDKVIVEGKVPSTKKHGIDTIYWFDLQAGEKVKLRITS